MPSARHQERLALGSAAVFSLLRAAELLPIADSEARVWLRREGLVRLLGDKEVVVWGEVVERLRGPDPPAPVVRCARGLRRTALD